jgi:hypothetical protein
LNAALFITQHNSNYADLGISDTYKVKSFAIAGPYTLRIGFDDGVSREIDFRPVLDGELYGPLRDLRLFEHVKLMAKFLRWCGLTVRILIRQRCMTGLCGPTKWPAR